MPMDLSSLGVESSLAAAWVEDQLEDISHMESPELGALGQHLMRHREAGLQDAGAAVALRMGVQVGGRLVQGTAHIQKKLFGL